MIGNKVAVVTGASRGIGYEIAIALANKGVNLVLVSKSIERLSQVKSEIDKKGVECYILSVDLANPNEIYGVIPYAEEKLGRIDYLVNNAGIAEAASIEKTDLEMWDRHIAINAKAPFILCKEATDLLAKSDVATIINISSVVGKKGYINQGAYSASKHALMGLSKVLARELQAKKIRVHTICPGGVGTEMVTKTRPDLDDSTLIKPKEIADLVMFLIENRGNGVIDNIDIRRATNIPFA